MTQESIVEKIKKLLALAHGNQNEHEREVAMQFAMDLLSKHNLSMREIESHRLTPNIIEVDSNFRLDAWIRAILRATCKLYYTEIYVSERFDHFRYRQVNVPVFIGSEENIAVTIDVASWLIDSVRKESNRAYKDAAERRSFRLGAADRILDRAYTMVEAEKNKTGSGTSLMVIRNQLEKANEQHLARLNLRPGRSRSSYVTNEAYADGEAFGNQVGLKKQPERVSIKGLLPDFASIR